MEPGCIFAPQTPHGRRRLAAPRPSSLWPLPPLPRLVALLLLWLGLSCGSTLLAADPYAEALDKRVSDLENGLKEQDRARAQGQRDAVNDHSSKGNLIWPAVLIVLATVAARFKIQSLNRQFAGPAEPHEGSPDSAENLLLEEHPGYDRRFTNPAARHDGTRDSVDSMLLEEHSAQAFYDELRAGPSGGSTSTSSDPDPGAAAAAAALLNQFLGWAPAEGAKLRSIFCQTTNSEDGPAREQALLKLSERLRMLCYGCRVPRLQHIWQLSFALEGLTRQLVREPAEVTPSTLQTVAGGVDLLRDLCADGLKLDYASQPAARFLVVDDDAVSRFAVAASLKKVFEAPDLAPDAEKGLALAARQVYDGIFLDVEMPGMDGFELCKRIRETACNSATPIVFVTCHSDFESRAKAALSGGQYLLGKPFLSLEITVKALTMVMRSRLLCLEGKPMEAKSVAVTAERTSVPCD
jgi:CheY-like chemotaxis protein